jgi:putative GTP pyrophosphokinase
MARKKVNKQNVDISGFESEYSLVSSLALRFADELCHQLNQLLDNDAVALSFPIQYRLKSWQSISEKLLRKSLAIKKITELNDLVGLRLILQFRRDIETVCRLLSDNFTVIEQYDTSERLKADQFGYSSIHFVIELPEKWLSVPTLSKMRGLRAEIQIRTTAQHIWAAASHTLQYKHEESVPPPIRRAIHRVSALLETVDLEFERVLGERETYREEVLDTSSLEQLNVDLLEKTLDKLLPNKNKAPNEPYAELLEDLVTFKINSPKLLSELITEYHDKILEDESIRVQESLETIETKAPLTKSRVSLGVFYFHVGLVRCAMQHRFGEEWNLHNKNKNKKKAERIIKPPQ